jgi:hypothetical protein
MVVAPPIADLRYPPIRWQTVFLSTRPLTRKSVQKDVCCGIYATVWPQLSQTPLMRARLFSNTAQQITTAAEWRRVFWNALALRDVAADQVFRDRRCSPLIQRAVTTTHTEFGFDIASRKT